MKKYTLLPDEKKKVKDFDSSSIPWIFKSGKYIGYFLWIETIQIEVCSILLKGEVISKQLYKFITFEDSDYEPQIDINDFQGYYKDFYDNFLEVIEIAKKYYYLLQKKSKK